jgi:uncharacterized protein (TIGR02271 family)
MTQQTITALFDKRSDATQAIEELVNAGIPRDMIKLMPENDTASTSTAATRSSSYDKARDEKGFWESLSDLFMPDEDRYTYAEAMNRGSIMVTATIDEWQAARAEDILEERGTVNIDEREASWREEGWGGYDADGASRSSLAGSAADNDDGAIPIVEEELKVGKRQVSGGRVKVRSYVVETPVSEEVSLRSETVNVERRPADRALSEAESDRVFQDRTIEAEERDEEVVLSKTARVTGEVVVTKGVEERTETVQDTVRSTKVDVDDERRAAANSDRKVRRQR